MQPKAPSEVQVFFSPPNQAYTEVAVIEARQESLYSSDDESAVLEHLRQEAAQRGCDGLIVQGADTTAGGGSMHRGGGFVAVGTLRGYRGICILFGGGGTRAGLGQTMPTPAGALGYRFTDTVETAEKVCKEIGGNWAEASTDAFRCDRLPNGVGFAGSSELMFCEGKLCGIDVNAPFLQPTEEIVLKRWDFVQKGLEQRYGPAWGGKMTRPPACARGRLLECIDSKQAVYQLLWEWTDGYRIELLLDGPPIGLRIVYRTPARIDRGRVRGL